MKNLVKSIIPKKILNRYKTYKTINSYKGGNVECPVCNSKFRVFKDYGLIKRSNALCHNCGSLERHRLLYLYLSKSLNIFDDITNSIRVLHFAPKKAVYSKFDNCTNIEYVPCDLHPEFYEYSGRSKISKVDITNIPYNDESFDFIICNHVLEHIPNDQLAMSELYRVMKYNGNGIFQVPINYALEKTYEDWNITSEEEREKAFGQHDHVRVYGRDYIKKLEQIGFVVNEVDYISKFSSEELYRYGLISSEKIYHCRKVQN